MSPAGLLSALFLHPHLARLVRQLDFQYHNADSYNLISAINYPTTVIGGILRSCPGLADVHVSGATGLETQALVAILEASNPGTLRRLSLLDAQEM